MSAKHWFEIFQVSYNIVFRLQNIRQNVDDDRRYTIFDILLSKFAVA